MVIICVLITVKSVIIGNIFILDCTINKKKKTIKNRNWKSKKRSDGSACCRIIKLWYIQTCMDNNHHASFAYFLYPKRKTKIRFFWWVCWGIRKRVCQSPWSIKYRDACKTGATTNIIIFPLFMFLRKTHTHTHTHTETTYRKSIEHKPHRHNSHWHDEEKHRRTAYLKANFRVSGFNFQV